MLSCDNLRGKMPTDVMDKGMTRGMADTLGYIESKHWSWADNLSGGDSYLIWPGDIKYKGSSPYFENAKPFYKFRADKNQNILEAISAKQADMPMAR